MINPSCCYFMILLSDEIYIWVHIFYILKVWDKIPLIDFDLLSMVPSTWRNSHGGAECMSGWKGTLSWVPRDCPSSATLFIIPVVHSNWRKCGAIFVFLFGLVWKKNINYYFVVSMSIFVQTIYPCTRLLGLWVYKHMVTLESHT